jgi:hypothetical protein
MQKKLLRETSTPNHRLTYMGIGFKEVVVISTKHSTPKLTGRTLGPVPFTRSAQSPLTFEG